MGMDESDKIELVERRVGAWLAPLGFSVSARTTQEIEFSRTVEDDVVQVIQVVFSRYGDKVCARYGSSRSFMPVRSLRMVLGFVREHCPWARPAEGEWVWYDGDDDFPNAVDKLIFMIKGVGFDVLDMLTSPDGEDGRAVRDDAREEPPVPGRAFEEVAPLLDREVRVPLGREERTELVRLTIGPVLLPLGFAFEGWDDFTSWGFYRRIRGDFDVISADRRSLVVVESDTAEQTVTVIESRGTPLLGLSLNTNTWSLGRRDQGVMRSLMERVAGDYPEVVQGLQFVYHDAESYAAALGKMADVLARYGVATLDALCERRGDEGR